MSQDDSCANKLIPVILKIAWNTLWLSWSPQEFSRNWYQFEQLFTVFFFNLDPIAGVLLEQSKIEHVGLRLQ